MKTDNKKKTRIFFRNSTYKLNEKKLKILFAVGSKKPWETITQKNFSEMLNEPLTSLNYHFKDLKKVGLIDTNNKLTTKGEQALRYFKHWDKTLSKKLRAHKIQISCDIASLPSDFFKIKHKILSPFTNSKYRGLQGELLGSQILFYSSKKLVLKIPDVFGNKSEELIAGITSYVEDMRFILEEEFSGLKLKNYEICKFNSMHVAVLNSIVAETFLLQEKRTFQGSKLAIDKSHGVPELECEKICNIFEDIEFLISYDDLVKENKKLRGLIK